MLDTGRAGGVNEVEQPGFVRRLNTVARLARASRGDGGDNGSNATAGGIERRAIARVAHDRLDAQRSQAFHGRVFRRRAHEAAYGLSAPGETPADLPAQEPGRTGDQDHVASID